VLYLFMTIWQLNEGVLLKCTVYRAEVSATFHKFSVPGSMPNMAQSKRFRDIDTKKKKMFSPLSTGTKKKSCNPGSKLTGHLKRVILLFVIMLLFLQPHLLQLFYVCQGKTCPPLFFHSAVAMFFFLVLRTQGYKVSIASRSCAVLFDSVIVKPGLDKHL